MKFTTNADLMRIARLCRHFDLPHPLGVANVKIASPILKALQTAITTKNHADILLAKKLIEKSITT